MKKKDLLIPLAMLALGAGIGFWTRDRQQPVPGGDVTAAAGAGANEAADAAKSATMGEAADDAKTRTRAPGQYPAMSEMNAQTAPGYTAALPPLDAKVADIYDELKARAQRGDGKAACRLAIDLQQCADRDFMLEGADRAAQLLQERGAPKEGEASTWDERRLQFAQHQVDYALALDERCKGVSTAQMTEHSQLWRRAALTGHVPSMVHYARGDGFRMRETLDNLDALAQYKSEAERLMRAAAAAGSVEAAQQLALGYQQQRTAWASLFQQAVKPNPNEALTLSELAKLRDYAPMPGPRDIERWNRNPAHEEGLLFRFNKEDWDDAKDRAAKLNQSWAPADDSDGHRRSPWERADYARKACDRDQFTRLP